MENFKYLTILCLIFSGCSIQNPARGQKVGRIVKLAEEGVFFKTHEGELIRGGLMDGSGSMGSSFHFTVEDKQLIDIAYQAFEQQKEVIITYESEFISSLARSDHHPAHFVKNITIVDR